MRPRESAGHRCEYCRLRQDDSPLAALHVEHIIPKFHGGSDDLDNLALACIDCNLHKGPNLTGLDPVTDQLIKSHRCFIRVFIHGRTTSSGRASTWQAKRPLGRRRSECCISTLRISLLCARLEPPEVKGFLALQGKTSSKNPQCPETAQ